MMEMGITTDQDASSPMRTSMLISAARQMNKWDPKAEWEDFDVMLAFWFKQNLDKRLEEFTEMLRQMPGENKDKLKRLIGPHGYTIYRATRAKYAVG
jgi:hypothetical protein